MSRIFPFESYEEYVKIQSDVNKLKLNWVYLNKVTIEAIVENMNTASTVLCHGTRNGAEQKYFKHHWKNAEVLGTEISDTATQFPMTVEWDMQKQKDEWVGKWDVVYTNAFDHCIYPIKALQTWKDQLSPDGALFLEYSERQSVYEAADPLDATLDEVMQMMTDVGFKIEKTKAKCAAGGVLIKAIN